MRRKPNRPRKPPKKRSPPAKPLPRTLAERFGRALDEVGNGGDAAAAPVFRAVIQVQPKNGLAHLGLGLAELHLGQAASAARHLELARELRPTDDQVELALAFLDSSQLRYRAAVGRLVPLLQRMPGDERVEVLLADALNQLGRYEEALEVLETAEARAPRIERLPTLLGARARACDWRRFGADRDRLRAWLWAALLRGEEGRLSPFGAIELGLDRETIEALAVRRVERAAASGRAAIPGPRGRERIRVGYLAAELHDHPVGLLLAPLLEHHDRDRFEVIGLSTHTVQDRIQRRISRSLDELVDLEPLDDAEAAETIRARDLDLVVDLIGVTGNGRCGILARRPAPVRAHYLAYPGSLPRALVDYHLLGPGRLSPGEAASYQESVVMLPETFVASEGFPEPSSIPSRSELGLPDDRIVFGFFGAAYRIEPRVFDAWCQLLRDSENSVMWIQSSGDAMKANLRSEAAARGISSDRLLFAAPGRLSARWHHTRCDLWLDGWHVSSGTAAIVAMWTGTPLLTLAGTTPQSRTGAGIMAGAGMPELVTDRPEAYLERARAWAAQPEQLAGLRAAMAERRASMALFNLPRFVRHLEEAYREMVERGAGAPGFEVRA